MTGGAGYIGSHAAVDLLDAGWDVVVVDDFSNSSPVALERVAQLVPSGRLGWHRGDICDTAWLTGVLSDEGVDAVVHFAALKAVGESVAEPLRYYRVNVAGTISLVTAMEAAGVRQMVFSSSCTVYGAPDELPVRESAPPPGDEPVRADQDHGRGPPRRRGVRRPPMARHAAAVLQPGGGAPQRPAR